LKENTRSESNHIMTTEEKNTTTLDIGRGETLILPARKTLIGGLKVAHHFSKAEIHPYDDVPWALRNVVIMDYAKGKPSFKRDNVEAPAHWSENSVKITTAKYLFGNEPGQPQYEDSLRHAFDRIANTYTVWGWKNGYFASLEDAKAYNWELKALLVKQMWAPNSPVWFNLGHWEQWRWGRPDLRSAYQGKGNHAFKAHEVEGNLTIEELDNPLQRPQASACFLTEVDDSMESILEHQVVEGRIFSSGSGVGINISRLRSSYEPISGKGRSSGPLSFNKGWDRMAGAIKSGGKCLAPWQQIYTAEGPQTVESLAKKGHFVCLSFDPMENRIMAKPGQAWMAEMKEVVEIITDKGNFALSADHPVRTADHQIVEAGKLKPGTRLHAGTIDESVGYLRVHLQNGRKGKEHLHRLIARDILGADLKGKHVHHANGEKQENSLENLVVLDKSEHARMHNMEAVEKGEHVFQMVKFPKKGSANPMHRSSTFWTKKEATRYRRLQAKLLKESGRASAMQGASSDQRMLNMLWKTANAGGDISCFDAYYTSRKKLLGKVDSKTRLKKDIAKRFGSYEGMLGELNTKNHTVVSVRKIGFMETYDVEVTCPSPDDKTAASGHNFMLWSNSNSGKKGSGIFVLNTRRAARMVLMDSDHPNTPEFLALKNSQEDMAKIILREHNSKVALKKYAAEKTPSSPAEELAKKMIAAMPVVNEKTYDGSMDGEVYGETVSDQNANHSISLLGDFWNAYWSNGDYSTRWVTDKSRIVDTFPAKDLLRRMSESVWHNAEPGCHNNDWINLWNPVKSKGRIDTSNPCSEYLHMNGTSCNLSAFNIYRFLGENGQIDHESLRVATRLAMIAADLNIEECGFPDPAIAKGTYIYRTTGIGYGNIGGLLMALGIPYDSDEGRFLSGLLVSHLTAYCWQASAEMGRELGAYREHETTAHDLAEVLRLHHVSHNFLTKLPALKEAEKTMAEELGKAKGSLPRWDSLDGKAALRALLASFESPGHGWDEGWVKRAQNLVDHNPWDEINPEAPMRNSFVSLMQPGGTVSGPMGIYDEGTTSIEPDYTLVKYKTLSGGGSMTMFNSLALKGLKNLGYDEWQVREAALEVAGINGLIVACNGQIQEAANHLADPPRGSVMGPIREAFENHPLPTDVSILDIVVGLSEGRTVEMATEVVNGRGNVEGIPWLSEHHKAVFDCAATLGGGKRSIAPAGHIKMLGAIQPFLSGSSSKTCNLPHSATVEEIIESFELSHKMGVKCIALYRADSKGISVYSSDSPEASRWVAENMFRTMCQEIEDGINAIEAEASKPKRRKLPGKRSGQIVKFDIGSNLDGFIMVGTYPDGRCGEVFGRLGQGGSFAHGMFESFCKAFSVMLQWGVPINKAIGSFKNIAFDPSGFVKVAEGTTDADIRSCKSVVDLMMRILEWLFPESNGYRLRDYRDNESLTTENGNATFFHQEEATAPTKADLSSAEMCPECHSLSMIQDGKCKRCTNCGWTGGGCGG
jgi:ribonucleoside-diphosphate reductase alpha chain